MTPLGAKIRDLREERGISLKNEYFIADAIQLMIDKGKKVVPSLVSEWRDCGNDEALLDTNRYLLETTCPAGEQVDRLIIQPSFVDATASIERSIVGPHASIGSGVVVRDSLVSDSIVEEGALIDGAHIRHSIVGRNAEVRSNPFSINVGDLSKVTLS